MSCLVRQAEMSVKEIEEWGTGMGMRKWEKCFDCGQFFHGAVFLALGWAGWKTYLGRPETDGFRYVAISILGKALRPSRPKEALQVLEAQLALNRRYWSRDEESILIAQSSLANCLINLGRYDEALVLRRRMYSRLVVTLGVSHESTICTGNNLVLSLNKLRLWEESKSLARDQLLPAARQFLGTDSNLTLSLNQCLAEALENDPARTRDHLRLNKHRSAEMRPSLISTQAMTCWKPGPSSRTRSSDDGGSSAARTRVRSKPRHI